MSIFYLFTNYENDYFLHNNIIYVYYSSDKPLYAIPSSLNSFADVKKGDKLNYDNFKHLLENRIVKDYTSADVMKNYINQLIEKIIYEKLC
jgi:hypothetical protein